MRLSAFILLTGLMVAACSGRTVTVELPYGSLREGDLAFRCGRGVFSRAVTTAEEEGVYSHVGLLIRDGGQWKVVHAVPGERDSKEDFDRVKMEDLEVFYSPGRAYCGALVHTGLCEEERISALREMAVQMARDSVRFDGNYTLKDSSQMYCTELVWRLYRRVGVDLSEGRRKYIHALNVNGDVLLPEHLLHYSGNTIYYKY